MFAQNLVKFDPIAHRCCVRCILIGRPSYVIVVHAPALAEMLLSFLVYNKINNKNRHKCASGNGDMEAYCGIIKTP